MPDLVDLFPGFASRTVATDASLMGGTGSLPRSRPASRPCWPTCATAAGSPPRAALLDALPAPGATGSVIRSGRVPAKGNAPDPLRAPGSLLGG